MMQEIFNKHYNIGLETFKVVFLIKEGSKLDAGMMPYHVLEVQKLPENIKYHFHKGEVGLNGQYGIIKDIDAPAITWNDSIHKELINAIKNEKIPGKFFLTPHLSDGFF
jgi:hypothetical protein